MFCAMGLGFRPRELFALRWDDIEAGRVRVDESASPWGVKEPKTQGSDTYLPMPAGVQSDMDQSEFTVTQVIENLLFDKGMDQIEDRAFVQGQFSGNIGDAEGCFSR